MKTLVLIRHGQSTWNQENRFTGWKDVDLTDQGVAEAHNAAKLLTADGFTFDCAFTSVLKRAIRTLWILMDDLDLMWLPVERSWRLNERHYGALQGLSKSETAKKHGAEQVKLWRRGYSVLPPQLDDDDERLPSNDRRYASLSHDQIPRGESLELTVKRVLPHWNERIVPTIQRGERVLIAAHGNSLRALVQHLDGMSEAEILELNIPTGVPLIYELDDHMKPISRRYLGDQDAIEKAIGAVAGQGSAQH